ncbi:MAG TPA: hypothetical protein VKB09_08275 [Thermomicrobiales bacterium]|nr:hypothetical protein [Thermomicrobiales bacterium]
MTLEVAVNEILRTAAELQFEIRRRPIHVDVVDIDREDIRAGRDDADACGGTPFRCESVDVNDRKRIGKILGTIPPPTPRISLPMEEGTASSAFPSSISI